MATQVQRRKGTTAQHSTFTGAIAELTVDTTKNTVVVHDGVTAGGTPLAKESGSALSPSSLTLSGGTANGVAYLNGSKVLTTGSALTFDGTRLYVNGAQGLGSTQGVVQAVGSYLSYGDGAGLRLLNTAVNGGGTIFALTGLNGGVSIGGDGGPLVFSAAGSEQMRLTSTGLGIGTSSPAYKLDVSGQVRANGVNTGSTPQLLVGDWNTVSNPADIYMRTTGLSRFLTSSGGAFTWGISGGAEEMRLDSFGNLGLGVTPSAWGSNYKVIQNGAGFFGNYLTGTLLLGQNWYDIGAGSYRYSTSAAASYYQQAFGVHSWYTAPSGTAGNAISFTQAMTLDASGRLLVGTTSFAYANTNNLMLNPTAGNLYVQHASGTASGQSYAEFTYNATLIGSITQSGTTAVLYNITSDQRLKENIQDADNASTLIDSLKVRQFDWKADGSHQRYGFVAQELVTVAPEAVHQPADPEEMMAVDYSKLVPMLVKEIQSLRARVAQLESN